MTGKVTQAFRFSPKHYALVENYDPDVIDNFVAPDKVISLYTLDDLATMRIAELKEVPEYSRISLAERRGLRSKQDFVDAIIRQRQPSEVAPRDAPRSQREAIGD